MLVSWLVELEMGVGKDWGCALGRIRLEQQTHLADGNDHAGDTVGVSLGDAVGNALGACLM